MNIRLLLAGLVVAGATGCSSPNHTAPTPLPTSVPSVVNSPSSANSGTDQQVAQAAILNQQDMGPDYQATPYTPTADDAADDTTLGTCLGRPPTTTHERARVDSPKFTLDYQVITASIIFADTNETARADIAALRNTPRAMPCLKEILATQLGRENASAPQVEVSRISPPPGGPDVDVVAYRLRFIAEVGDQKTPYVVDMVSALKGRAEMSANFVNFNQSVMAEVQDRAVRGMLDRLAAAGH